MKKREKRMRHLKYEMIGANLVANLVGVFFVFTFMHRFEEAATEQIWQHPGADLFDSLFTPLAFVFVGVMTLIYEAPIRDYLNRRIAGKPFSPELETKARLRLLNEPFVLILLDLSMWGISAISYPALFWAYDVGAEVIQQSFINSISTGLITVTVAFFLLEHVLQKRLAPFFFPEGGLSAVPRTIRIRIRTRLVALLVACNIIPLLNILFLFSSIGRAGYAPAEALKILRSAVFSQAIIFIAAGLSLTILVSRNLSIPFREIIQSLRDIRRGRFEKKIQVTSNDEIGYTGDVINEMAEGLREREQLRYSLVLAKEVQQNLLPKDAPEVDGIDVAGASMYCEETGGDYFDYLDAGGGRILLVVGDVSDHGIASAMLMTTARAFLRQRASRGGRLEEIVTDVNGQLVRDVEDSGRFMTLFLLEADRSRNTLCWVNAGHDSAMVYDSGDWVELARTGLPLGVSRTQGYVEQSRRLDQGQIILVGTDGVWEAQDPDGRMFGKPRFQELVRTHRELPAGEMLHAVIEAVSAFCGTAPRNDDVTLVILKIL